MNTHAAPTPPLSLDPLYNAPDFPMVLPHARTKNGVGQSTKDLTEHPWAGTDVAMILTARDQHTLRPGDNVVVCSVIEEALRARYANPVSG